jgi:S1-C subfamily serine protease
LSGRPAPAWARAALPAAAALLAAAATLGAAAATAGCHEASPDTVALESGTGERAAKTAGAWGAATAAPVAADDVKRVLYAPPSFAALAAAAAPSVVSVFSAAVPEGRERFPFGEPLAGEGDDARWARGLGSGFVIDADGDVLTTAGVIEGADLVLVSFHDGSEQEAKILGRDRATDLALLQVKPRADVRAMKLGDSDKMEVGDWIIAVGNPYGLTRTVTAGVVSAKGRSARDMDVGDVPTRADFFQTDASINEGNAGGPLLNVEGEVVGVAAEVDRGRGIHFAVPINLAARVAAALRAKGRVDRSFIGVLTGEVTGGVADHYGLPGPGGAIVREVLPGSPAEKAGLRMGDVVLEIAGKTVGDPAALARLIEVVPAGKTVELKVVREGKARTVKVAPVPLPDRLD